MFNYKRNPVGGYVQGTSKNVKEKNPIPSGWYRHPKTKQVIWYDSKTNSFHDKITGPARATLSVGWKLSGGKDAEDLVRMTVKGAKRVIPALWEYDKARRKELGETMDASLAYYKKELTNILVSDKDPGFIDTKDTTGQSTKVVTPKTKVKQSKVPSIFSVKDERIDYYDKNNEKVANDLDKEIENLENSIKIGVKMK